MGVEQHVSQRLGLPAVVIDGVWHPGIGDPTFIGWFTAVSYFVVGAACLYCASKAFHRRNTFEIWQPHIFWGLIGLAMMFLAANKQLDLQSWFTLVFKHLAQENGWYGERRVLQFWFVAGIGLCGIGTIWWFLWILRSAPHKFYGAVIGLSFLATFIVIRAASFHHVDRFLALKPLGFEMNWILELTGIFLVGASAIPAALHYSQQPRVEVLKNRGYWRKLS